VAYRREGAAGCLRVPLVGAGEGTEWAAVPRWMLGVRVGGPRISLGVRGGRWLGPVLAGVEGAAGPDRASVAVLAQARVFGGIGLELDGMGWWELAGTDRARGSFRYGPRGAIHFMNALQRERLGGLALGVSSLAVGVGRWLAAEGEAARTEISLDLVVWWNPQLRRLGD
jgi:hypothetical protein